jgi:haloalkane dehalogenase
LFDRIILGNGGLPDITEPYAMPADIDAAVAEFQKALDSVPPQQPPFYDENGNPLVPPGVGANTGSGFGQWIAYAMYSKTFKTSMMVEALTYKPMPASELAAYNAPFPTEITMAGARAFPSLINQLVEVSIPAREKLKQYNKPFLTAFGANEQGFGPEIQQFYIDNVPGAAGQAHHRYPDASHFVQDDKGQDVAARVSKFMAANPIK